MGKDTFHLSLFIISMKPIAALALMSWSALLQKKPVIGIAVGVTSLLLHINRRKFPVLFLLLYMPLFTPCMRCNFNADVAFFLALAADQFCFRSWNEHFMRSLLLLSIHGPTPPAELSLYLLTATSGRLSCHFWWIARMLYPHCGKLSLRLKLAKACFMLAH